MGTLKGSETRGSSTFPARKHKSRLSSKKPASMAQNARSQHFLPRASVVEKVNIKKRWEEWEDQLIITLRKEGKNNTQISQYLPGRSEGACKVRWLKKLKTRSLNVSTRQEDAPPSFASIQQNPQKRWEDGEDQIVIKQSKAGKSWEDISKMLPPRTVHSVRCRWNSVLEPLIQDTVKPQTRPHTHWKEWEDQVLKTLVGLGHDWAEIAAQLPSRTAWSCRMRWSRDLIKIQGPSTKGIAPQWQDWEERLLVSGYYAGLSWKEIAERIPGRTMRGARTRWTIYLHASDQDRPWTSEELALLAYLCSEGRDWDEISRELPEHSSNACKTQWYKETEGIKGPPKHQGTNDTWSAAEVDLLVTLYNTIGPRWQEICKHIPGRTEFACRSWFKAKCTKEDGVGEPPSEVWKEFFMSE